jgi:hypothetical protein
MEFHASGQLGISQEIDAMTGLKPSNVICLCLL